MKQTLLSLIMLVLSALANAKGIKIDGVYYNLNAELFVAEITEYPNVFKGNFDIPETVVYNGVNYKVSSIGNRAFVGCKTLTSITIPNSITTIGNNAFSNCSGLTSITIPNSVTSIGDYAFSKCSGLVSVRIPNSFKTIGNGIFSGCSSLTSVNIPNSITHIGNYAFEDCKSLTSINLSNIVTFIGKEAFWGCSSLTTFTIPNSVTSIEDNTFSGCSGLSTVTIPNSVTRIGSSAFRGCSGLSSITIPNSVTSIASSAFEGCTSLTAVYITDLEAWCKIDIHSNPLSYAHHLYLNGKEVKELAIPNSVTSIEHFAFYGCSDLTSVIIPNSVTDIGQEAFAGCNSLTSITIPNSVTRIGYMAFSSCSSLTSVTIPNSVTSIGDKAFKGCSDLTAVHITDLDAWCKIIFYDNPLYYAHHLYLNGKEIKELVIPNSVTSTGNSAFMGCSSLTSVTIPNSVTFIGDYAFCQCSGLTSVTIPNSVTSIGWSAFSGCRGLTSVTIPNSVTSIGDYAFEGCSGLTSVTIGSGVKGINSRAFANCPELKDVYCYAESVPSTNSDAFKENQIVFATLHVPASSVSDYRNTWPWKNFKWIIGINQHYNTLTYMVDGIKYKEYSVGEGDNIIPEPVPTKDGYTFSGWSSIPTTMPASDVIVTGTFIKNTPTTYTLTYMVDGQVYMIFNYASGTPIAQVELPTKDGYTFSGWGIVPSTMPARNITINGSFSKNALYKITYMVDGEVYKTIRYDYRDIITPEPEPTKDGYTFSGWSWIPKKMPDEDVTITGTFTPSTGVETAVGSGRPFDVYIVTGRKVRSQVTSLKGLKKGVYIVEGKKVVVK